MTINELNYRRLLKLFYDKKCLTLEALAEPLDYSIRSVQRLLKKTGYYSSFTHNNKWYVLHTTPSFNEMGLWFYKNIGFSKHGNLGQTIFYFINKSHQGLTAKEISELYSSLAGRITCNPKSVILLLQYHKLEKKTLNM